MELHLEVLVISCLAAVVCCRADSVTHFDVKPSGQHSHHSASLGSATCVFSFTTVGGTNEDWQMTIKENGDKSVTCIVERPMKGSYLFFQKFAASLTGMEIASVEAYAKNQLSSSEYKVDFDTVAHVDGQFKSALSALMITSKPARKEL
ncbi:myeloid-derived growth factor-like [Sycon ciliatum]|uniref:myeloid-derived growth factor-like n=1 Tax=Sycon ciliatum TaxID=27933 RepID=UPI0020A8C44C|eukprot:scpid92490/ scgid25472/ UPF0556 protein C19orf10 homolog; Interleukin-25; Stromal cell-derived growth factor SF20